MLFLSFISLALGTPQILSQQGRLLDSAGQPFSGTGGLTIRLFDAETGGSILWEEVLITNFTNGYYHVVLGENTLNPLESSLFDHPSLYWELEVNNDGALSPRTPVHAVPYAFKASEATSLSGGEVNATQIKVDSSLVIDSNGSWVGAPPEVSWDDLTNRPADLLDGDHDTQLSDAEVENMVTNSAIDLAGGSTVAGNSILTESTTTLDDLSCSSGELAGWDGSSWVCLSDGSLSPEEVREIVVAESLALHEGTTLNGESIVTPSTDQDTLGALNCAPSQSVVYDQSSGWTCAILAETISDITCAQGETLTYDESSGWTCSSILSSFDQDGDGVFAWEDCDDNDASSPTKAEDGDCDGLLASEDCNDSNPASTAIAEDGDCDGFVTAADCDDTNPSSTTLAMDADCDGTLTADDCDDTDSSSATKSEDGDCDGTLTANDCDDTDATSTTLATDADCDTVLTADDCDDADSASTTLATDADCDTILTADDCDDTDPALLSSVDDGDCDGYTTPDDCDDYDPTAFDGNGQSSDCAGSSCLDILNNSHSLGDGSYWLSSNGSTYEATCDMTTDGGGWTQLLSSAPRYGNTQSASTALAGGSFSEMRGEHISGYVACSCSSANSNYPWQACSSDTSIQWSWEILVNGSYLIAQSNWFTMPSECEVPSTATGDILCTLNYSITKGDSLTPTWQEPSNNTSLSDNCGTQYINLWAR